MKYIGVRLIRAGRLQELLDAAAAGEVDAAEAAQWEKRFRQQMDRANNLDRARDMLDERLDEVAEQLAAVTEARDEAESRARLLVEDLEYRRACVGDLEAEIDTLTKRLEERSALVSAEAQWQAVGELRQLREALSDPDAARVSETRQRLAVMAVQLLVDRAEREALNTGQPAAGLWTLLRMLVLTEDTPQEIERWTAEAEMEAGR